MASSTPSGHIGIIGSGLIGKSWAMIFASVGYKVMVTVVVVMVTVVVTTLAQVVLYDVEASQVARALDNIKAELVEFESAGTLRCAIQASGHLDPVTQGQPAGQRAGAPHQRDGQPGRVRHRRQVRAGVRARGARPQEEGVGGGG